MVCDPRGVSLSASTFPAVSQPGWGAAPLCPAPPQPVSCGSGDNTSKTSSLHLDV